MEPAEAMISSNKSLDVVVEANEVCNRTAMARNALVRERINDVICRPTLAILQPLIFTSLLSSREELPNMQGVLDFNTHDRGLFRPYKRTNAKRTKSGCLSCRARHTKCDEHRPICGGCTRNHLLCSWTKSNGRIAQLSVSRHERSPPQKVPSLPCLNVPSPRYALSHWPRLRGRSNEQSLLRHYIERSAQRLIVRDGIKNPFLTYVLPLAQQNDAFLHIVFAISASHLSYDGQQSHVSALSHYAVALREAKYLITEHGNDTRFNPLELMMLLILLCNFEVMDGNTDGAVMQHLRPCSALLAQNNLLDQIDSDCACFIAEQYMFFGVVNEYLGLGPVADIDQTTTTFPSEFAQLHYQSYYHGRSSGCGYALFEMVPQVALLATKPARSSPRYLDPEILKAFDSLEKKILLWEMPPSLNSTASPDNDEITSALIQQMALLVTLQCALNGPGIPIPCIQAKIEVCVCESRKLLRSI